MPECTADIAKAKRSAWNTLMGCEREIVFTFALSLVSRTDDRSLTIRIFETDDRDLDSHSLTQHNSRLQLRGSHDQ